MIERGNWTNLKRPRRWLPWGRWRVLARLWMAAKADQRMELMRARKRSMDMARGLARGRQVRIYSREAGRPGGAHPPARGGSTPPPASNQAVTAGILADWPGRRRVTHNNNNAEANATSTTTAPDGINIR